MTPEIFRQRYPYGGLISELAAIEHGQFIVRVVVELEGKKLASGLAAAPSVEQAEDQARIRALNLLGSGAIPAPAPTKPTLPPQAPAPTVPAKPAPAIAPPTVTAPTPPAPTPSHQNDLSLPSPAKVVDQTPQIPLEQTQATPDATLDFESAGTSTDALDFSEIIARSDVELKRLGWSSEQGRTYLLETYGKRSRQLLSDDELLEFLQYLESQPTPS
ncbi:hypothetical protein AWQ21_10500 [Picosynechococcus sp. PCC 7003]|uniref:hypothetical protein n=1 Tax=Picosynechococcus sp. PCC 7003 TaxID=374981 RepID=UPI000810373D|nr:hypothetical protein [Picosynechococcus sp. PCC 7003]ANV84770.1 hypothetical protein AWQ21_10500 [Picosynechococcus sp. PCC 7003]